MAAVLRAIAWATGRFNPMACGVSARLAIAYCAIGLWAGAGAAEDPAASNVLVATVEEREVVMGQTFVGTVLPKSRATIASTVEGRVVEFLVREGDRVVKDQVLARLRTQPLEFQLAGARAEGELRRQELAQLENGSRPEEVRQANAKMLAAQAMMDFTRLRVERIKPLLENNSVSQDEFDERTAAAAAAVQSYLEAKAAWELAVAGPRKEQVGQAEARRLAAQELVRRLEDELKEHTVRAPLTGYITKEHTQVGQWLTRGGPVVELVEIDTVEVEAAVLEDVVRQIQAGAMARVEVPALPETLWSGPVTRMIPQADLRSRSFPIRVQLTNRPGPNGMMLKPGMFARVTLPVGGKTASLLVPKDALVLGPDGAAVWVAEPENGPSAGGFKVRRVVVDLGASQEDCIVVRGALKAGQRVVVGGNERLKEGQAVAFSSETQQRLSGP